MATFRNTEFKGTTVVLDGSEYYGCNFKNCRVVVTRGNFRLENSTFDSCAFEFGGEAENIKALVLGLVGQQRHPTTSGGGVNE